MILRPVNWMVGGSVKDIFMLVVLDEFNAHAAKHNAILDPIDGASSLANLKTTVTLIPDYPARTAAQLKNSVRNKLGS